MTRIAGSIALSLLCLSSVWAQEEEAFDQEVAQSYLRELVDTNTDSIRIGELTATVTLVPDYVHYIKAKTLATVDPSHYEKPGSLAAKLEREAKKHHKHRDRPAVIVRYAHEGVGPSNFYAFETSLNKKVTVEGVGRGKQKTKVADSAGRIDARQYTLFKAGFSKVFGGNTLPVMKRKFFVLEQPHTLDLVLKKELHPKIIKLKVRVKGFIHFHGSAITKTQMDFERGARAELDPGGEVEFRLPLRVPEVPGELRALLGVTDE